MWWQFASYIPYSSGPSARVDIFLYPVTVPGLSSLIKLSSWISCHRLCDPPQSYYFSSHPIISPHFSRVSVPFTVTFTSAVLVIICGDLSVHNDNIPASLFLKYLSSNYLSCTLTTHSQTCHNQYFQPFHNLFPRGSPPCFPVFAQMRPHWGTPMTSLFNIATGPCPPPTLLLILTLLASSQQSITFNML